MVIVVVVASGDDDSDHSGNNDGYFLSWGDSQRRHVLEGTCHLVGLT